MTLPPLENLLNSGLFQTLVHTVTLAAEQWRVLDAAHRKRNTVEYEGLANIDEQTTQAIIRVADEIRSRLSKLRQRD